MIGNSLEYLSANNKIIQIMKMIQGDSIFDELKPIQASGIVDLSLTFFKLFIQIPSESGEDKDDKIRLIQDMAESSNTFIRFAEDEKRQNTVDNIVS